MLAEWGADMVFDPSYDHANRVADHMAGMIEVALTDPDYEQIDAMIYDGEEPS